MFQIGDHVRIIPTETRTDEANKTYANRTGIITDRNYSVGLTECYKVMLDEPFYEHGYLVDWLYIYDYHNGKIGMEKIA